MNPRNLERALSRPESCIFTRKDVAQNPGCFSMEANWIPVSGRCESQRRDRAVAHPKLLSSNLVDSPEFLSERSLPELFS